MPSTEFSTGRRLERGSDIMSAAEKLAADEKKPIGQPTGQPTGLVMLLGALGVVFGDIGTSPLYAFKAALLHFQDDGSVINRLEVYGVLSMVFWSLVLIVTVKYVLLVMRADNQGEGGILSLMALAQRVANPGRMRYWLGMTGIIGACLFFGDGVITPAISVLSAVEGLEITYPAMKDYVLPIASVVIVALFMVQWRGTSIMGRVFGPIMAVWFLLIGLLGLLAILHHPKVLLALSPGYAGLLLIQHRLLAFIVLGSVVLAVTGAEALYADMGHFGGRPIKQAWLWIVLPALTLNYFGQGALILHDIKALDNPFFLLTPHWLRLPMVLLATAATVIASQAMISGAFSMARQCVQLGFLPRMTVRHTSETEQGQIYVPQVNSALLIGVLALVLTFRTSDNLAAAYGIAVTGTFLCTGILAVVVFRRQFGWSRRSVMVVFGFFFLLDSLFFASNMLKIPQGGYVPLVLGGLLMAMMTSWSAGRRLLMSRWRQDSLPLASFLARLPQSRILRVPGTAVFLTGNPDYVPGALLHNLKHNKVLHERVLFLTVKTLDQPEAGPDQHLEVEELAENVYRVIIRYGFKESPNIPRDLDALRARGVPVESMQVSYFFGRETIVAGKAPKMPLWRLWLFLVMARNAVPATEFFRIPSDRVVELGVRVPI
ncbi:Kup system potassium uptake protein [Granulibacter bethesdensis CGDNIH4]|nr:Kup system potassium uptake protein [Granulibacter bethesdensis CGDNIH4]